MRKFVALFSMLAVSLTLYAKPVDFPIKGSVICIDSSDYEVVETVSAHFSDDVELVSGMPLAVQEGPTYSARTALVFGTIGKSSLIDGMVESGKIDVSGIKGKWECYSIQYVTKPIPGIGKALVVAGSDRRGTAFGIFELSRMIGVSPWAWWAEAPVEKNSNPVIAIEKPIVSREPSVKYRGVFINDEDWGLLRWARTTLDKDIDNIGPNTYAKVCELLLRLKANLLHPAMHEASIAFNKIPENRKVADRYAIIMGSTHCEPLLFNNASEWNEKVDGPWNYETNAEGINSRLRERVKSNAEYENVYTLALRGMHDRSMQGSSLMKDRVATLDKALAAQRSIVSEELGRPAHEIPQIFMPYKEVLDVYDGGLNLPDDVTLVWPDDNFGYMKRLSNPNEQKRSGRAGVYYHVSYLGQPHQYLWLDTTHPTLMYEELRKVYDTSGDRLWVVNAGDIKSCEFGVDLFLAMAYDIDRFSYDNVWKYRAELLSDIFGKQYYDKFLDITTTYYQLAFERKPEHMGWGYDWNNGREKCSDTEFSWVNYNEAEARLAEYDRIAREAHSIYEELPESSKDGFLHMLYYPVDAASLMNKVHLLAQKNREYAAAGRISANKVAADVKRFRDSVQTITMAYDMVKDGKWIHVMGMNQCSVSSYYEYPRVESVNFDGGASWGLLAEGTASSGAGMWQILPCFNSYLPKSHFFEIYSRDGNSPDWKIVSKPEWVSLESGTDEYGDVRVDVTIDWSKVQPGRSRGDIRLRINGSDAFVSVPVFNVELPADVLSERLFVEENGVVSISAADYSRKKETESIKIDVIDEFGYEGASLRFGDPVGPRQNASRAAPNAEYDFYCFGRGMVDVYTYVLPTFPLYDNPSFPGHESSGQGTRYGVMIDEGHIITPGFSGTEYSYDWYAAVMRNASVKKSTLYIDKPGRHTIRINCGTPGMVLQKIVIDLGGMERSWLGPRSTKLH